jgi:hypothetical protein
MLFTLFVVAIAAAPVEAAEVIVVAEGATPGWRATFVVHGDANDVLDVVVDQPRYSKTLFSGVKSVKVLSPQASGTWQMEYIVEGAFGDLTYVSKNVLRRTEGGGGSLSWSRVSGALDVVEGSWVITPRAEVGWSDVEYTVRVAMGPGFLQGFVRDGVKENATGIASRMRGVLAKLPKRPAVAATEATVKPPCAAENSPWSSAGEFCGAEAAGKATGWSNVMRCERGTWHRVEVPPPPK